MEKAREATDLANIRSAYAECSAAVLTGDSSDGVTYTAGTNGAASTASKDVVLTQKTNGWVTSEHKCGNVVLSDDLAEAGKTITVSVTDNGAVPTFNKK